MPCAGQPAFGPQLGFTWTLQNYSDAIRNASFQPATLVFVEVHVDPPHWLQEAKYIQSLADQRLPGLPSIGAIVAYAPVEEGPAVATLLEQLVGAVPLLRGIRRPIPGPASSPPEPDVCAYANGAFVEGVRSLARFALHFEFLIEEDVAGFHCAPAFIRQIPEVTFVVEHLGTPDIAGNTSFQAWADTISALAQLPNTYIKLSGAPREDTHNNTYNSWSVREIRPYAQHLFATFGYQRVLFGGNWFFVNLSTALSQWTVAVLELLNEATPDQRAAVLGGNALRVYRLEG
jgi:L-fuconolactonase